MKEQDTGEVDALREENERLRKANIDCVAWYEQLRDDSSKAWLIEIRTFSGGPRWWTGAWGSRIRYESWTTDAGIAVRFNRREDAEQVIRLLMLGSPGIIATEHIWPETEEALNG